MHVRMFEALKQNCSIVAFGTVGKEFVINGKQKCFFPLESAYDAIHVYTKVQMTCDQNRGQHLSFFYVLFFLFFCVCFTEFTSAEQLAGW